MSANDPTSFDPEELDKELRREQQRRLRNNRLRAKQREEQAALYRRLLFNALGHKCAICGSTHDLEVDHIDGRAWHPRDLSYASRYLRYIIEFISGVRLRTLCARCNGKLGGAIGNRNRRRRRAR